MVGCLVGIDACATLTEREAPVARCCFFSPLNRVDDQKTSEFHLYLIIVFRADLEAIGVLHRVQRSYFSTIRFWES